MYEGGSFNHHPQMAKELEDLEDPEDHPFLSALKIQRKRLN